MMTRTVEVRICESTAVDENLWTISNFEREHRISQMSWEETCFNFTNCLGESAQLCLEKVCNKYLEENGTEYARTEAGFKLMIKDYIRELCNDEDAKGTLKREIFNGI